MADKKRKTLQIKRPDPNSVKAKKNPIPKIKIDPKAAKSPEDNDQTVAMDPDAAKVEKKDGSNKGKTTRITLPDEDKIRKARRANATQDLVEEDALPSAEQIAQAQKNATMPIMIDTESVEDSTRNDLDDTDESQALDQTMEIDADALSTGNIEENLKDADQKTTTQSDQTMEIDPEALATGNIEENLKGVAKANNPQNDQTMQIDPEALATGNLEESLNQANATHDQNDQTLEIDQEALTTANLSEALDDANRSQGNNNQTLEIDQDDLNEEINQNSQMLDETEEQDRVNQTKKIDPAGHTTGNVDSVDKEDLMAMETMSMESLEGEDQEEGDEQGTNLTVEEMKETFNAQTMEMDQRVLEDALAKKNSGQITPADEDEDRSQTMDLSDSKPKTIMIKRPSKKAPSSHSTPTVKAVRPDAATVRTSRPVTANPTKPKQDTSRVDVPGDTPSEKEGKTIKLRRPSGTSADSSKSQISRVANNAGLTVNDDGSVSAMKKAGKQLGVAWLAVAIITFLISAGAVWSIYAQLNPEIPMPGRLVNVNNQLMVSTE